MPLFHIQDSDRPMWVMSADWESALSLWKMHVAIENEVDVADVEEPLGIQFVADENDLIWK